MSNIYNLISKIREYLQDENNWEKIKLSEDEIGDYKILCSALDVVNDINEAICGYLHLNEFQGRSMNYIYIYGIINCLHSQSLAVKFIYSYFLKINLNLEQDEDLYIVRIIRNKVLAHSVEKRNGFGIVASTINTYSFQPHSFQQGYGLQEHNDLSIYKKVELFSRNEYKGDHFTIDIKNLITNHQTSLEKHLQEVVNSFTEI